jgi:hypothetical protein
MSSEEVKIEQWGKWIITVLFNFKKLFLDFCWVLKKEEVKDFTKFVHYIFIVY